MTEAEWIAATEPRPMLEFLRGRASDRKLQLFAVASFRRLVGLLPDPRQRHGIEVLEQLADGSIPMAAIRAVKAEVRSAIPRDDWVAGQPPADDPHYVSLMLYREFVSSSIAVHAVHATGGLADGTWEQQAQARLMRDITGPLPFRPMSVDPSWLTSDVLALAECIYQNRAFDRMPILADALQDAGCDYDDVLNHCRQPGEHVRGCWVVDLLTGRQ